MMRSAKSLGFQALLWAALLFVHHFAVAADALQDGPYILKSAGGWLARSISNDGKLREVSVKSGDSISVAAVGAFPEFSVTLRGEEKVAPDEIKLRSRTPLFVMADSHGVFEIAVQLLRKQGVIDDRLRWSFGKGHLAILGDVFDRGEHQTELLWLIYKLEAEAQRAGGGVHMAIGNHEAMVMKGDARYLNPKYQQVAGVLGASSYSALWNEDSLLGRWLRTKPAVFRLGDYLCLHGGISRELLDRGLSLAEINATLRAALATQKAEGADGQREELVMGRMGPMWYRGYFPDDARKQGVPVATAEDIELTRRYFKVREVLVGHTVVQTVTPLFDGKVVAVQVYPHRDQETGAPVMEGLLIQRGKRYRARVDGSVELLTIHSSAAAAASP